jgi:hypothetical protein
MPATQTKWEEMVNRAMGVCVSTFGDGVDENGQGRIQYTHVGGTPYYLDGIFEAQSVKVDPDTGAKIISNSPQVSFQLSALQQMPDLDDEVEVRGYLYRVVDVQLDGQGTVTLPLNML